MQQSIIVATAELIALRKNFEGWLAAALQPPVHTILKKYTAVFSPQILLEILLHSLSERRTLTLNAS